MMRKTLFALSLLLGTLSIAFGQDRQVTGKVTDATGEPLPGVTVLVVGTTTGSVTSFEGKYTLNIPAGANDIKFSSVGYKTQVVAVGTQTKIDISLQEDAEQLEEVMVVAYGTAKKSAFTGSASTISSDAIVERQSSNITNTLVGQTAGVQIQNNNGQPGSSPTVRIRGIGSMASSNKPLYVVDGIPFDGDVATLNPQDIASMTVLKDAASNALYGARGANGVILITTKKGKTGEAQITFDAKVGVNRRGVPNYDVMKDPAQYYETFYSAFYNNFSSRGASPEVAHGNSILSLINPNYGGVGYQVYTIPEGQDLIGTDGKLNPNATLGYSDGEYYYTPDNWEDEIFGSTMRQEYNVSVSGATDKMNYYFSFGYLNDEGIAPGSAYTRYTGRLRADYQAKKWLKLTGNFTYTHYDQQAPRDQSGLSSGNLFYLANSMAPIYPLYVRDADGNIMKDNYGYTVYDFGNNTNFSRSFMNQSNPASTLELDDRRYVGDVVSAKGNALFNITKDLNLTVNYGADVENNRYHYLYNPLYGQFADAGGIVNVSHSRTFGLTSQYLLNYAKAFGEHDLEVMAGYENYNYTDQYLYGSKTMIFSPTVPELDNGILEPQTSSNSSRYMTEGFLARLQYNYADKYFASFSFRRDASSNFSPENRWGNFWSAGFGWLLNKENFMADVDWVDMLKFKASIGQQGNDYLLDPNGYRIFAPYQTQKRVIQQGTSFALTTDYIGNSDITWETSTSFNTGFDFGLFGNKLNGSIEYFSRVTDDMLYYAPVEPSEGYSVKPQNIGSMLNKGVELDLSATVLKTSVVDWSVNFNATHVKNEIVELAPELGGVNYTGSYILREGESRYQLFIPTWAGVDDETGKALWYKDIIDEDGNVTGRETTDNYTAATDYEQGDMLPSVYGGFGTRVAAFGFDLSVNLSYQLGGKIYDSGYAGLMHTGTSSDAGNNWHTDILDAWTPENPTSDIPQLNNFETHSYANAASSRFLVSSDYLNLANISLGYTVPSKLTKKLQVQSLRFYVVADNVALLSSRSGLDPRQSFTSTDGNNYSAIRSFSGGLTVKF